MFFKFVEIFNMSNISKIYHLGAIFLPNLKKNIAHFNMQDKYVYSLFFFIFNQISLNNQYKNCTITSLPTFHRTVDQYIKSISHYSNVTL